MGFLNYLRKAQEVISVAPFLLQASLEIAEGLEEAIPEPRKGEEKKQLAKGAMKLALDTAESVTSTSLPVDALLGIFDGLIDLSVGTLNLLGRFTKDEPSRIGLVPSGESTSPSGSMGSP